MSLIGALVLAGLVGLLGVRSATVSGSGGGYTMSVRHAQVTRAGVAVPFHVRVTRSGGFDRPLTLSISEDMLERFDFQNWYPNPSKETTSGGMVLYEFEAPPGNVFELDLDARTAPDQNGSTSVYRTMLVIDGQPMIDLSFRLSVAP